MPFAHSAHDVNAPEVKVYRPGSHLVQFEAPVRAPNVPLLQYSQDEDPALLYVPIGHNSHDDEPENE